MQWLINANNNTSTNSTNSIFKCDRVKLWLINYVLCNSLLILLLPGYMSTPFHMKDFGPFWSVKLSPFRCNTLWSFLLWLALVPFAMTNICPFCFDILWSLLLWHTFTSYLWHILIPFTRKYWGSFLSQCLVPFNVNITIQTLCDGYVISACNGWWK